MTLAAGITWGVSDGITQYLFSTEKGVDSTWLVTVRLLVSGFILFFYCLLKYKPKTVFAPWKTPKEAILLVLYGLVGISGSQLAFFTTIQLSSAGTATIMQSLSPIFVLFFGCIVSRRFPFLFEIISVILAIAGAFLLTTHGSPGTLVIAPLALVTGVLCAVAHMIYNVTPGVLMRKYPVVVLQAWAFVMGAIAFLIIFRPWRLNYVPSLRGIICICFIIFVSNIMAYTIYITGIKYVGPEKSVLYGFAEPVVAAIISTVFLGTPFKIYDAIGFALIFGMLLVISLGERIRNRMLFSKSKKKKEA